MLNISSLPLPSYSFPSLISNWSEAIHADTDKWIEKDFHFLPQKMRFKYQMSNFGLLSARCLPEMPTYAHLQVAGKFMLTGTLFDDFFEFRSKEELAALHYRAMEILDGSEPIEGESEFFWIFSGIYEQLVRLMPGHWRKRFAANVGVWINSMIDEVPYKDGIGFPPLAEFMELRQRTIGVQAYLDLIEMQLDYCLPDEIISSDYMKQLYSLVARVSAWLNDFVSLLKEIGRDPLNLVFVLQNEYTISLEQAYSMAMEIHDHDVRDICQLQNKIPDFGAHQEQVKRFVEYLGVVVQGQHEWYMYDTNRYKAGGHPEKDSFIL